MMESMLSAPRSDEGGGKGESRAQAALGALPDRECIILARGGSRAALGELAGRHLPTVYRLCSKLLRNRDDAADATQEVFLRACRALARFDKP